MTHAAAPSAPMIGWRWIAIFWFAAALFEATQSILIQHSLGRHGGEALLFVVEMAGWLPWALATPFVIELARRHPVIPAPTARGVAAHLIALLGITLIAEGWSAALHMLFNPWAHRTAPTFWDTLSATLIFHGLICLFAYLLILAITYLVDSRDKVARKVTETALLGEELSKAQLAALLRQMEPHFMFNTLNSIAGLVRDDRKAAAVEMIVGLSEILRRASRNHQPETTLAEEVEYVRRYVDIQKVRFGDRLRYGADIPDALMNATVPSLLLQPLVENAIKHGPRSGWRAARSASRRRDRVRRCPSPSPMTARSSRPTGSRRAAASASPICAGGCRSCMATPPTCSSGTRLAAASRWSSRCRWRMPHDADQRPRRR
ncbi:sensor histidine kinase [Sphingosinicella sp.]|uniref:sensor histidine kinase n=1 Tax=Sphingosinicella sp. TaxID=1917971 RepID=UPI0040380CD2